MASSYSVTHTVEENPQPISKEGEKDKDFSNKDTKTQDDAGRAVRARCKVLGNVKGKRSPPVGQPR